MFAIFKISLLFAFLIALIESTIVTIGNYSQLNPQNCGISRQTIGMDTKCFEWHKGFGSSALKRSKNVTLGDAPWVVLLKFNRINENILKQFECSGSIIANEWVLTAAHCMKGAFNIRIYTGYNFTLHMVPDKPSYTSNITYIHPDYLSSGVNTFKNDLALVKMNKQIDESHNWITGVENSICLPKKWLSDRIGTIGPPQYAMVSGWGHGLQQGDNKLQIGYWKLINKRITGTDTSRFWIDRVDNQGSCHGDSGSPIWQYDLGRAVIVGVFSQHDVSKDKCSRDNVTSDEQASGGMWIDQEIDWIQNITKLN